MALDLVLRQARRADDKDAPVDVAIAGGRIVEIAEHIVADAPAEQLDGRLVIAGFVESHIHLDKSRILERCDCEHGTLEKAITHGTTRIRTHVEIDPRVGLKGFQAVRQLKRDYAWAIDLQICAFPQEGLTNDPGTEELLVKACQQDADVIGGCPYTDTEPHQQIARIFGLAHRFDLDVDFHLDFDLDPSWMHLDEVCRQTDAHGWGGRVAVGHVTKLSAIDHSPIAQIGREPDLRACFDMITTLPAQLMNAADYGVAVGHPADLVVLDSRDPAMAVAELAQPSFGLKRGRRSFSRAAATLHHP